MIPDRFRSLEPIEPPDRWNEILLRIHEPELAMADLPIAAIPWQRAARRVLIAAAAVIVLVMMSVAAFGTEDDRDSLTADQPGSRQDTTTSTATTITSPGPSSSPGAVGASTTTGTAPGLPDPTTPAPEQPTATTAPPSATTAPPPATFTTLPWPHIGLAPKPVLPHNTLGGVCPAYFVNDAATLRPGPSPVWSLATATRADDSSTPTTDGSWPPNVVAHGELSNFPDVTFEIGMGIGVSMGGQHPEADLSASLVMDDPATWVGTTDVRWPGFGQAGVPAESPPDQGLDLPPIPAGRHAKIAVLTTGSHPNPACDNVYVALTIHEDDQMTDPAIVIDMLLQNLLPGSPP